MSQIELLPSTRLFVLTGAGISAESGIRTFRDSNGLWENHRVEEVASPEGFAANPRAVWRFYSQRRAQAKTCGPNPAHAALAAAERILQDQFFLCTQNVDALHEAAGAKRLVHMHGELFVTRCSDPLCESEPFADTRDHFDQDSAPLPRCACGALQRPHIVWFGEVPFELPKIAHKLTTCDIFLCVGSSGQVYPAAGFVSQIQQRKARGQQATSVYVGLEAPENANDFDHVVLGKAGEVLPNLFK